MRANDNRIDILFLGRDANHPGGVSTQLEHFCIVESCLFRALWDALLVMTARHQIRECDGVDRAEAARRYPRDNVAANAHDNKFCIRKKALRLACRPERDGRLVESDKNLRHMLSFLCDCCTGETPMLEWTQPSPRFAGSKPIYTNVEHLVSDKPNCVERDLPSFAIRTSRVVGGDQHDRSLEVLRATLANRSTEKVKTSAWPTHDDQIGAGSRHDQSGCRLGDLNRRANGNRAAARPELLS
ncbi:MAG: hypothetical protein ABI658_26975 [Acidimicrobiales bacterium]